MDATTDGRQSRREQRARTRRRRWYVALAVVVVALAGGLTWVVQHRQANDPAALFERARGAFERRDYAAAEVDLRALLARESEHAEARLLLGRSYLERGNAAGALKEFGKAREVGLEDQTIALGVARAQLLLGKLDEAEGEIALHAIEGSADWKLLRGSLAFARGQFADAEREFAAAVAARPELREARLGLARVQLARGELDAARREASALLATDDKDAGLWALKGVIELQAQDAAAARTAFERALALAPRDTGALLGLAEALLAANDTAGAAARLDETGEAGADDPRVNLLRARIAEARKDPEQALVALNKVLHVLPKEPVALAMGARLNFALGAYTRAEEFALQLLEVAPADQSAQRMLGAIRLASGRLDGLEALGIEGGQGKDADNPAALALLGTAYLKHGKYQDAEVQLSRAAALAPDSAPIRTAAALGKLGTGAVDEAIGELRKVVADAPDFGQARALLVLALTGQKRVDEARAEAQAFVDAAPGNALAHNLLGYQREASGDEAGATEAYRTALAADADFHVAHVNLARQALRRGDRTAARAEFAAIEAREPKHLLALLGLAGLAIADGDAKRAEELWLEARKEHADAVQPRVLLSRLYRSQGKATLAEAPAREAWKLAPFQPVVQLEYADAMLDLGDHAAGLEGARALLARDPDNLQALERVARASRLARDEAGLLAALRRITAKAPTHVPAQTALAHLALADKDFAAAERIAKTLQAAPEAAAAGDELAGDIAQVRGDGAAARAAYARALERQPNAGRLVKLERSERAAGQTSNRLADWLAQHPDDLDVRLALASTLQEQGERDGAIAAYEQILAKAPEQAVALNNLAWLYFENGDERATDAGRRAYERAPREAAVVDTYAWILFQRGQREQGLELLRKAAELAPDNPDIGCHLAIALADTEHAAEARALVKALLAKHARFALRADAEKLLNRLGRG
ncbi:MAG: XrtA/PEP-CTERM system TPR-repeat protein PrsT [Gammaproteobacteria bacterium]